MLRKIVIKFRILLILGLRVIMFGFNIFELMVVLVVAIIFLGPDKLPKLIVDAVKFFKMIKKSINEAKETLDKELQISELKKEALEYKSQFEQSTQNFTKEIQLQDINAMSVDEMFKDYKDSSSESRGKSSVPALELVPESMPQSKASPKSPKKAKAAKASGGVDSPLTSFEGDFGGFDEVAPSSVASSSVSSLESATKSTSANSSPAQSTPKKSASKKPARTTPTPTEEALQSYLPTPQKPLADAPSSSTSTSAPSPAPSHQAKPKVGKTTSFKKKES